MYYTSKIFSKIGVQKLLLLSVWFLFCNSCTVKYSTTGASISPDLKTVSVAYFPNRSENVQPQFSQQLTEKLREKIRQNTNLVLISDGGDAQFEGEITGFSQQPTAIQGNETAAKNRFTVSIKVKFINTIDPKQSFDASFSRFKDYSSEKTFEQGTSEFTEVIIDELTEDIFNKAFVNW